MEPKNFFILVCRDVLQNVDDARHIACIQIFDTLYAPNFPHTIPKMTFVARYGLGQGTFSHHFEIHDQGRLLYKAPPTELVLPGEFDSATDIFSLDNIAIESAGVYWVKSCINGVEAARTPLLAAFQPMAGEEES